MLAYRTTTGSAPTYFHSLLRIYIPSRSLRSASERCLVVPSQRYSKSLSRTFSFTVPGRWNDLPPPHPERWIPVNLQATTENSSLSTLLDFIIKKKYIYIFFFSISSSFSLPFSPSLASLYLFEQCLRLGVKARTHRDEYRHALFASVFQRVFCVHTQAIFADEEPSEHANSFPDIRWRLM